MRRRGLRNHVRFSLRLHSRTEMLIDRERRMAGAWIKEARFPAVKSLESFDFAHYFALNKTLSLWNSPVPSIRDPSRKRIYMHVAKASDRKDAKAISGSRLAGLPESGYPGVLCRARPAS